MRYTPAAVIPGILIGILSIVFLTALASGPETSWTAALTPSEGQDAGEKETPIPQEPTPEVQETPKKKCSLPASYPASVQQWCKLIRKNARQYGLDPTLIAAMILQESGGDAQAYSYNGAVGLMQIMPRDGAAAAFQCINGPCFANRPSIDELLDPAFNIAYGAQMLAGLIERYGSVREALAAYGPTGVGYYYADIVLGIQSSYQ